MNVFKDRKTLLMLIFQLIIFLFYWNSFLSPLFGRIEKTNNEIGIIQKRLEEIASPTIVPSPYILYSREEQTTNLVKFIDGKVKQLGIKLVSLRQTCSENRINFDVVCLGSNERILKFLGEFEQEKMLIVIDSVKLLQKEDKLEIQIKLVSVYL